jgi:uncharacterized protein (DUF433 family)
LTARPAVCALSSKQATTLKMDRIEVNPAICSGKPVIRGTRIMIRNILGMVAGGYSVDRIVAAYPELTREDVVAAVEYAAEVVDSLQVIAD